MAEDMRAIVELGTRKVEGNYAEGLFVLRDAHRIPVRPLQPRSNRSPAWQASWAFLLEHAVRTPLRREGKHIAEREEMLQ